MSAPAAIAFLSLECLIAIQALLVHQNQFFSVAQMRQGGIDYGLPFAWHFGMWGDLFIISPLAAYLIDRYFRYWQPRWIFLSLAIGFAIASFLHWLYTFSAMPESHIQNHRLTAAGVVHLFYMSILLSVFILFFFFTHDIPTRLLRIVSALLFVHVFFGTHMALGILNALCPLDWYPGLPLKSFFGWTTIAAVVLGLLWRNFDSYEDLENLVRRVVEFSKNLR